MKYMYIPLNTDTEAPFHSYQSMHKHVFFYSVHLIPYKVTLYSNQKWKYSMFSVLKQANYNKMKLISY